MLSLADLIKVKITKGSVKESLESLVESVVAAKVSETKD